MTLLIWLFGGVVALGHLAATLPPRTWWLGLLAGVWMVGLIPAAIFSMQMGRPAGVALRNSMYALKQYLFVMGLICIPGAVLALLAYIAA